MRFLAGLSGSLLVLALAATGCGGDDAGKDAKAAPSASPSGTSPSASAGPGADAGTGVCELLTPGDLEAAFGVAFGAGKPAHQEHTGADECTWTGADAASQATFTILVLSQDRLTGTFKSNGTSVAELFAQSKLAYPNAKAVDLGDEAFAAVSELQVLDRDTWYSLSVHGAGDGAIDKLKKLATRLVGRS